MTWKERRTVTLLLSIIAVLFAALLIVFGMRYREGREEALAEGKSAGDPSGAAALANPGAYSALRYYNGSATLSFSLDEAGRWIWADGPDFPLNPVLPEIPAGPSRHGEPGGIRPGRALRHSRRLRRRRGADPGLRQGHHRRRQLLPDDERR